MPERLDYVKVDVCGLVVVISWAAREALLEWLSAVERARPIVDEFRAVGATRPVKLPRDELDTLLEVINGWADEVGVDGLPRGVGALRLALLGVVPST
jgi:hypothetical protein